jgi:6-phosphogluconolactonase
VFIYKYDAKKGLADETPVSAAEVAPGSGPRHFAFGRGARFLYVVNELSSTVTAFKYDERRGTAELVEALSTLPAGFSGDSSCAEIAMHPSGKFLYASNRGHDSIAIFSVAKSGGRLALVGNQSTRGRTPRSFEIDPSGRWLMAANQSSDNLAVFLIDPDTGLLTPKGPLIKTGAPVCVKFLPMK